MTWTCTTCDETEPFDPPHRGPDGEALCETCHDAQTKPLPYPVTD